MSAVGLPVDVLTVGAALWAAAFSASFLGSMIGAGGGLVIIPVMHFIFTQLGLDSSTAMLLTVGTSACSMILTGPRGMARYHRHNNIDWDIIKRATPPVMAGAVLTHLLGFSTDGNLLKIVFASVTMLIGMYMAFGQERWRIADRVPTGMPLYIAGLAIGLVCPLVGITGTIIAIPLMVACGMNLRRAIGTASALTLMIGIPSTYMYLSATTIDFPMTIGFVNIPAAIIIFLAGYVGSPLGIMVQQKVPAHVLRLVFAGLLFISAGRFLWLSLA